MTEPAEPDRWQSILDDLGVPADSQSSPSQLHEQIADLHPTSPAAESLAEHPATDAVEVEPGPEPVAEADVPAEPAPPARGRRRPAQRKSKEAPEKEAADKELVDKEPVADSVPAEETRARKRRRASPRSKVVEESAEATASATPEAVDSAREDRPAAQVVETAPPPPLPPEEPVEIAELVAVVEPVTEVAVEDAAVEDEQPARAVDSVEDEGDEPDGADDGPEESGAPQEGTTPPTGEGRRRRRRRRKKGAPPAAEAVPAPRAVEPVDEDRDTDEPEPEEDYLAEDSDDFVEESPVNEDDEDDEEFDDLSNLNVPSWNDIVAGLYRPER